jgi:crotonobetainyl-CoA:carnitine CoA-transferase CaiB-like acyl-CoA transferase
MTDYITGLYAAFGAMNALIVRGKTGIGQCIDAALYECAFSFMEPWISAYDKLGHIANRCGSRLPESTPNNLYPTKDGQHIHITAMADSVFTRLCHAMKRSELLQDERYSTATARGQHFEALDHEIGLWTESYSLQEIEAILQSVNVPAMRIYTIEDIFNDPHYQARGSIQHVSDEQLGSVAMAQVVPRLSATPGKIKHTGGWVGASTRTTLSAELGLSDAELDRLESQGVIYDRSEAQRPHFQSA